MKHPVILDTGPLVAFFNQKDKYHTWAESQTQFLTPPLLTCEAVLTETSHLLQSMGAGTLVCRLLERQLIKIDFQLGREYEAVSKLMQKYHDVPMSLADACVVRMSELWMHSTVFTLDSDFAIYRKHNRQVIPLLTPERFH